MAASNTKSNPFEAEVHSKLKNIVTQSAGHLSLQTYKMVHIVILNTKQKLKVLRKTDVVDLGQGSMAVVVS